MSTLEYFKKIAAGPGDKEEWSMIFYLAQSFSIARASPQGKWTKHSQCLKLVDTVNFLHVFYTITRPF